MQATLERETAASGAAAAGPSRRHGSTDPSRRLAALLLVVVTLTACLPTLSVAYPPIYSLYSWILQGHILATLVTGGGDDLPIPLSEFVEIRARPVPNMGSTIVVAFFDLFVDTGLAGRLALTCGILGYGLSFAFLSRSVHRRPSPIELLGFVWAYGYITHSGYLSCLLSLGAGQLTIGVLHRCWLRRAAPSRRLHLILSAMIAIVWMTHIVGWAVVTWCIGMYSLWTLRHRGRERASRLFATLLPSVLLTLWHAALVLKPVVGGEGRSSRSGVYNAWEDKLITILDSCLVFFRTDPYPWRFPIFWLNIGAAVVLGTLVIAAVRWRAPWRDGQPLLITGLLLAAGAILSPVSDFLGMGRPDQRILSGALPLIAAALPVRRLRPAAAMAAAAAVLASLALHIDEYRSGGDRIATLFGELRRTVPPELPLMALTIPVSGYSGCTDEGGPTIGLPAHKWLLQARLYETGYLTGRLFGSGMLRRHSHDDVPQHQYYYPLRLGDLGRTFDPEEAPPIGFVAVLGCSDDVVAVQAALAPLYDVVSAGDEFAILRAKLEHWQRVELPEPADAPVFIRPTQLPTAGAREPDESESAPQELAEPAHPGP